MPALRELRRAADLSQQEFAALIDVPLNTFRMWDSGLRPVPPPVLRHAQTAATAHLRNAERLSLDQLAREFGVHERTLRAAARTGRLLVTFTSRSAFGRPIRLATRAAVQAFLRKDYRRFGGQSPAVAPFPSVPRDYDARLKSLRRRLRLTQHELARRVGAANKAVVYQWLFRWVSTRRSKRLVALFLAIVSNEPAQLLDRVVVSAPSPSAVHRCTPSHKSYLEKVGCS
jgi:DNA-binding transcriptional regulator YiaG